MLKSVKKKKNQMLFLGPTKIYVVFMLFMQTVMIVIHSS